MKNKLFTYENKLLVLMSITFGLVFVDRMALTYLSPFLIKDLKLNNAQLGMLVSGLSLTWAISGYLSTSWAEKNNKKKVVFVGAVVLFSLSSISSALATTFTILLVTRLLMGLSEGPTLPLIQSFIAKESSKNRLGFNMGFLQSFGSTLFGFMIAPVVLVLLAEKFGWRSAFLIAGIPGLIIAFVNWKFLRKSTVENTIENTQKSEDKSLSFKEIWKYRNMRIGILISCCMMTWLNCNIAFLPKYFIEEQHITEGEIGTIMGLMGLSSLLSGIIIPTLSDRFGRKPFVIIFAFVGVFYPLAILYLQNSGFQIPVMFITYFFFGAFPVVLSAIPSEIIPMHSTGKAIGMLGGAGEIVGGMIAPLVAGILADKYGISIPFYVAGFAALVAGIASFMLIETKVKTNTITN
jgi:MFS family permease